MIVRSEHILRAEKKGVVCQYKLSDAEREAALKNARWDKLELKCNSLA